MSEKKKADPSWKDELPPKAAYETKPEVDIDKHQLRKRLDGRINGQKQKDDIVTAVSDEVPPLNDIPSAECESWSITHSNPKTQARSFVVGKLVQGTLTGVVTRVSLLRTGIVRVQIRQGNGRFRYLWLAEGSGDS